MAAAASHSYPSNTDLVVIPGLVPGIQLSTGTEASDPMDACDKHFGQERPGK
jgi:hypothetical protein